MPRRPGVRNRIAAGTTKPKKSIMKPGIRLTKLWQDEDMVELRTEVCDGSAFFTNQIYVGHQQLAKTVLELDTFKDQVH